MGWVYVLIFVLGTLSPRPSLPTLSHLVWVGLMYSFLFWGLFPTRPSARALHPPLECVLHDLLRHARAILLEHLQPRRRVSRLQ